MSVQSVLGWIPHEFLPVARLALDGAHLNSCERKLRVVLHRDDLGGCAACRTDRQMLGFRRATFECRDPLLQRGYASREIANGFPDGNLIEDFQNV